MSTLAATKRLTSSKAPAKRMFRAMDAKATKAMRRARKHTMPSMWAVAGMAGAFAGGALIGMLGGKKLARSNGEGYREHHHHGFGEGVCCREHGVYPEGDYLEDLSEELESC